MTTLASNFVLSRPARRVLAHLRHGPMTVEELSKALQITRNAVRNQLAKLLVASFVARTGSRPGTSKPSTLYSITLEGQAQFSTLYLPVVTQFLKVAEERCAGTQLSALMADTGKLLADRYPRPKGTIQQRVSAGARLLKTLGGIPEIRNVDGASVIRSRGCPLATLTSENAAACHIIAALLTKYVGKPASICCSYEPEPRCCFEIQQ